MFVKPKELILFCYGSTNKCWVTLWPQQKWEFNRREGALCTVERKNISIEISQEDFDKYFEEWK